MWFVLLTLIEHLMEVIDIASSQETVPPKDQTKSPSFSETMARTRSQKRAKSPAPSPDTPSTSSSLIPEWKNIEEQLRCDICKQLLDVPVSLKCYHTFCSFCIRRYLEMSGNDFCPCCRVAASSTDIRLEPRLAGVLKVLAKNRGKVRKQIRMCVKNIAPHCLACKNETFNKQADLEDAFKNIKGDPIGRTLLPLYKTLKDKQLTELVVQKDGIEVPPQLGRDEIIKLHKEFLFTVQSAHDAVRMGLYPENGPTKQALASAFNAETRLRIKREAKLGSKRKHLLMTVQEKRRDEAEKSECVVNLTRIASERMAEQLRKAVEKRRAAHPT